ncbi:MAG TPA: hypothetical protein VMJ32_09935 [Pirellulales bacterium]|nr:hypothetical protein [Pirellulales bacterium]
MIWAGLFFLLLAGFEVFIAVRREYRQTHSKSSDPSNSISPTLPFVWQASILAFAGVLCLPAGSWWMALLATIAVCVLGTWFVILAGRRSPAS